MRAATLPVADRTLVRNIKRVYANARPEHVAEGIAWYDTAWSLALRLDPEHPTRAAGVIAALSPLTPWDRNVWLAEQTYAPGGLTGGTLGPNVIKANAIRNGADPLLVLGGSKVRAFFAGIVARGAADDVCVDRHAYDIAVGKRYGKAERPGLQSKDGYARLADAYVRAARSLGIGPQTLQAVTWVAWRDGVTA